MKTNVIYNKSCLDMNEVDDDSVHLIVTSPKYNVGITYGDGDDDNLSERDFFLFTFEWIRECVRVLVPGGRICINVGNTGRKPYIALNSLIMDICKGHGLLQRQEFIWYKGWATAAGKTSWGSWRDAKNPITRDCHEYVIACQKQPDFYVPEPIHVDVHDYIESFTKPHPDVENPYKLDCDDYPKASPEIMTGSKFSKFTFSVWESKPETRKRNSHPAPFPVDIPRRAIEFYTRPGMIVLDPFMGSGTTAVACLSLPEPRQYIGYEINPDYVAMAKKRLKKYTGPNLEAFIAQ